MKNTVISAFIFRLNPLRVALFRRSASVRTYQNHLGTVSGSVDSSDPSPLACAWREIHEETSLTATSLTLWRTGKPFTFTDPSVDREWTVHPFAFLFDPDRQAIRIDWEHDSWDWYDPKTCMDNPAAGKIVPRLQDSLHRVWFEATLPGEASAALSTGLKRLSTDRSSGSRELTTIALAIFRDVLSHGEGMDWSDIRMVAWHIWKNGRENMGAAIVNALMAVLDDMSGSNNDTNENLLVVDRHLARRKEMPIIIRIQETFKTYLQPILKEDATDPTIISLLTLSASSTIRDCIASLTALCSSLDVRILESRPLCEGASLASSILGQFEAQGQKESLKITLYTDAAAATAAQGIHLLLLGADGISPSGVCNKIGSLPAVLGTKLVAPRARILVLSEMEKVAGLDSTPTEENEPDEVTRCWRSEGIDMGIIDREMRNKEDSTDIVQVRNPYFESVPLHLIDALICEQGVLHPDALRDRSRRVAQQMDRLFGDL